MTHPSRRQPEPGHPEISRVVLRDRYQRPFVTISRAEELLVWSCSNEVMKMASIWGSWSQLHLHVVGMVVTPSTIDHLLLNISVVSARTATYSRTAQYSIERICLDIDMPGGKYSLTTDLNSLKKRTTHDWPLKLKKYRICRHSYLLLFTGLYNEEFRILTHKETLDGDHGI